jgi:hypothetical protein
VARGKGVVLMAGRAAVVCVCMCDAAQGTSEVRSLACVRYVMQASHVMKVV